MNPSLGTTRLTSQPCCSYSVPAQPLRPGHRSRCDIDRRQDFFQGGPGHGPLQRCLLVARRQQFCRGAPVTPCCAFGSSQDPRLRASNSTALNAASISVPPPVRDGGVYTSNSAASPPAQKKVGVILLNLGGPDTLKDVQPFLYNLFADDSIIRLPSGVRFLQGPIASLISTLRAPKSAEGYAKIGGGSPLRQITEDQAAALALALQRRGVHAKVYVGMRYWKPFMEDAMEKVKEDGITDLVALPLYPQFSISTSGSSLRLLQQMLETDPALERLKHIVIPAWYNSEGYLTAMADLIQLELEKFDRPEEVEIFFSAHGVPVSYVEMDGDPYKEEMEQCVRMVMERLRNRGVSNSHTLAYQSRVGPVEWLKPYTDDKIRELGAGGTRSLLAVPISFVSEHIETLEEIDMEYRELAMESGIKNWGRVPALNTNPTFIECLANLVLVSLPNAAEVFSPDYYPTSSNLPVVTADQDDNVRPPPGSVERLLNTYDKDKRALPMPFEMWTWGWTRSAETWNGRIAMIAVLIILALEISTGQGAIFTWLRK